jgi:hypothetical protein
VLTHALRRAIAGCVLRLEHVVRKLLLAEAAALRRSPGWSASPLARIGVAATEKGAAGAARSNLDPTRPESWPARFSFALPRDPLTVPDARAPRIRALWGETPKKMSDTHAPTRAAAQTPTPPTRVCHLFSDSAFRLARRFEALRRVLDDPIPHAQRLARVLARAVRRFPEIVRRFVSAPARTNDFDREDHRLSIEAMTAAFRAPEAFPDSS